MEQLLAKILNFSYELLGVFLPGCIFGLFLLLMWWCLGDVPPVLSGGSVPELTLTWLETFLNKIDVRLGIGLAIPSALVSCFLGNLLVWVSRSGKPDSNEHSLHLLASSLRMRIPKPEHSFEPALRSMFEKVSQKFAAGGEALDWRMFYPVGKAYLARNLTRSLVTTYQNKYTFHRSLVLSAAIIFWLCCLAMVLAGSLYRFQHLTPKWLALLLLTGFSLLMVNGFTSSYRLHWKMFGNTIITELYSILFGPEPKSNESK